MNRTERTARKDQVQETYSQLRELIIRGRLSPGSRLIEADLASRLGVSRTPVRSALVKLQQEGYVVESGSGRQSRLSVAPLTAEDANELWWIIGAVEGVASRWSASMEEPARKRLAAELERINERLRVVSSNTDRNPSEIFDLDYEFHRKIVEPAAGPRLLALHDSIKPQAERYWRLYTSSIVHELDISVHEHEEIIEAIRRGDPDAAQQAVEYNWHHGGERLMKAIETLGDWGSW